MPTVVWVLIWVAVLGTIAFFAIREIRSGRTQPPEFDRLQHEAVRQSAMNAETHGPRNVGGMGGP